MAVTNTITSERELSNILMNLAIVVKNYGHRDMKSKQIGKNSSLKRYS
jgi:hypothetical protein